MEKPRILIIGAGVNGSAVASGLFNGGVDAGGPGGYPLASYSKSVGWRSVDDEDS